MSFFAARHELRGCGVLCRPRNAADPAASPFSPVAGCAAARVISSGAGFRASNGT
jgi:hypothetical protein